MENKTVHEQLGIDISVSRVSLCFDERGTNSEVTSKQNEVLSKIEELRKTGYEKPVNTIVAPKKPNCTKEEWEKNPLRIEYKEKKQAFDEEMKKYEQYTSNDYLKANLAFKLTRKLKDLVDLMRKNSENATPSRSKRIQEIFEELKGGISKPIFGEKVEKNGRMIRPITGREIKMRFSDLGEVSENVEQIEQLLAKLSFEYAKTNALFEQKYNLANSCLKFSNSVRSVVTYLLQTAIYDILTLAIKDCKRSGRVTLSVENFRDEVISSSPYAVLFYGLDCLQVLRQYVNRKKEYTEEKREHDKLMRSKKKASMIKSFDDCERSGGFLKEVNGKKKWAGMFVTENDVNFSVYVARLFDNLKSDLKITNFKLSSRAKELVSLIMSQFLVKLSKRFQIHRQRRTKVLNLEGKNKNYDEKTIKFEDVIEMFEILICDDRVKETLQKAYLFRQKLKELKK